MKFDVPEVRECLIKNQEVYTVRSFESRDRFTVVPVNNLPDCLKEKICKIQSYKDLTRYTHLSGFKSPLEWWRKIEEMKAQDGWLYHVSVLEEESFESPVSTITFAGNRNISAGTVQEALQAVHKKYPNTTWRTGMAYGLDMAVAEFAAANEIPFEAHLPFPAYIQTKRWNKANQERHLALLEKAVKVFTHSQEHSPDAEWLRNVKMTVGADVVVTFNQNEEANAVKFIGHCEESKIPVIDGYSFSFLEAGDAQ
jgi:hypothetical protein